MKDHKKIKESVKEKYASIAKSTDNCCCCSNKETDYSAFNENYSEVNGYFKDADLNLGCGLPTEHASIKKGDAVLDLGSGAGNDCFIAREIVGDDGKVVGLDFTDEMINKANKNLQSSSYKNMEFVKGDIENIPLKENSFNVVISNCVLNLVPDKEKAFSEIHRTLKKGGHFCVSDIVLKGDLPEEIRNTAMLYAGCVSGALQKEEYLNIIKEKGFKNIEIKKERQLQVPDKIFLEYISEEELNRFKALGTGIFSITVLGEK